MMLEGKPRGNPAWKKGVSGNPGGQRKLVKEMREAFLSEVPASLRLAVRVRDDESEDMKTRMDAAKFICVYGLGRPPEFSLEGGGEQPKLPEGLSVEDLRALARQPLSTELKHEPDEPGDQH